MTQNIDEQILTGERALFKQHDLLITNSCFEDGESPLKECSDIKLLDSFFKWKYPMWYSKNLVLENCTLFEMARAGIWYTTNITMTNCNIEAPKNFRRTTNISLTNVSFANAKETLWHCKNINLNNITVVNGDYFAMNSENIQINNLTIYGNYSFDGTKEVVIKNSKILSKDAFWNSENVTVYDSFISGEYLGWNAKNLTLVNCTIESNQGLCYIENTNLINCKLIKTDLAFEYSTVNADVKTTIESIKNPISGTIKAKHINKIIFDDPNISPDKTSIKLEN
ncbi:MAG: DUF3737 family protein [Succinivibrionaceae bacterium]